MDQLRHGAANMPHPGHCSMKLILRVCELLVSPDAFQDRLKKEDKGDHIQKGLLVSRTSKFCDILAALKFPGRLVGEIPCHVWHVS